MSLTMRSLLDALPISSRPAIRFMRRGAAGNDRPRGSRTTVPCPSRLGATWRGSRSWPGAPSISSRRGPGGSRRSCSAIPCYARGDVLGHARSREPRRVFEAFLLAVSSPDHASEAQTDDEHDQQREAGNEPPRAPHCWNRDHRGVLKIQEQEYIQILWPSPWGANGLLSRHTAIPTSTTYVNWEGCRRVSAPC